MVWVGSDAPVRLGKSRDLGCSLGRSGRKKSVDFLEAQPGLTAYEPNHGSKILFKVIAANKTDHLPVVLREGIQTFFFSGELSGNILGPFLRLDHESFFVEFDDLSKDIKVGHEASSWGISVDYRLLGEKCPWQAVPGWISISVKGKSKKKRPGTGAPAY